MESKIHADLKVPIHIGEIKNFGDFVREHQNSHFAIKVSSYRFISIDTDFKLMYGAVRRGFF